MTDVGGTTLSTDANGVWLAEQAWFDVPLSQGTGGGVSALFDRPAWQQGVLPDRDPGRRLTPDVAAVADPFTGVRDRASTRQLLVGGGTSQAAPIWAGMAAVMNQYLLDQRRTAARRPQPDAVSHGGGRDRCPAFRDVTLGGNAVDDRGPGLRPGHRPGHARRRQPGPQPARSPRRRRNEHRAGAGRYRPTTECRVCQVEVPAGEFCGLCGVSPEARRGDGPDWLRPPRLRRGPRRAPAAAVAGQFAVPAPAAPVPQGVPGRTARGAAWRSSPSRCCGCPGACHGRRPRVAAPVPALPARVRRPRDLPAATLVLTAVLGIGLGVGWVLLTGAMVARSYGVAAGRRFALSRMLRDGLGVPLGGAILMLMPAVIVRLMDRPTENPWTAS